MDDFTHTHTVHSYSPVESVSSAGRSDFWERVRERATCVTCPDGLSSSGLPTALTGPPARARAGRRRAEGPLPRGFRIVRFLGLFDHFFTESHTFSPKRGVSAYPVTSPYPQPGGLDDQLRYPLPPDTPDGASAASGQYGHPGCASDPPIRILPANPNSRIFTAKRLYNKAQGRASRTLGNFYASG